MALGEVAVHTQNLIFVARPAFTTGETVDLLFVVVITKKRPVVVNVIKTQKVRMRFTTTSTSPTKRLKHVQLQLCALTSSQAPTADAPTQSSTLMRKVRLFLKLQTHPALYHRHGYYLHYDDTASGLPL
jgi:hypothetical protein